MQVENWRPAYVALRNAGMKDADIAALAGVSRAVINGVATGNYGRKHNLMFNGGFRVLTKLKELKANGQLPDFDFDSLRTCETSGVRPAGNNAGTGHGGSAAPSGDAAGGGATEHVGT
jgi:hypothetical protein